MKEKAALKPELKIYFIIIALTAIALGFSNDIISNYFKDAYDVSALHRGFLEFPRELPGVLLVFVIAGLSFLGDIRIAIVAQALSIVGLVVLGITTPPFAMMIIFVFINSLGMHLYMPVADSIGMSLVDDQRRIGKRMGQYKGAATGFGMVASLIVFVGFRAGVFSFVRDTNWLFLLAALMLVAVLVLYIVLDKRMDHPLIKRRSSKILFRKEYKYYYTLVVMLGVQKQIMMVYGPWVLIDLLDKKADTIALLSMAGAFAGMFFIPALGRWLDRFGIRAMLFLDALSFIGVYLLYGAISGGFASGMLPMAGWPVALVYLIFIFDKMSMQMGMVRTLYLRSIAVTPEEVTSTLSLGLSLDHVVSIMAAVLGGIIWSTSGPQFIFYLAAALSLVNLYVAFKVKDIDPVEAAEQA